MTEASGFAPIVEKKPDAVMVIGLIPNLNLQFLNHVWPVIRPCLEEIEQRVGEWTVYDVYLRIYGGSLNLYMAYADESGQARPEKFQEIFVNRLNDPGKGFTALMLVEMGPKAFHIFAGYVMPEYRTSQVARLGFEFIEKEARKVKAPALTTCEIDDRDLVMRRLGFSKLYTTFRKTL